MPSSPSRRIELTLRKPRLIWGPKPTVVLDGRGQPAQWGTGTWQVPASGSSTLGVFLFNRLWRYGAAEIEIGADAAGADANTEPGSAARPAALVYTAPWLPFLRGRLHAVPAASR